MKYSQTRFPYRIQIHKHMIIHMNCSSMSIDNLFAAEEASTHWSHFREQHNKVREK
jgi:hypothetical protein